MSQSPDDLTFIWRLVISVLVTLGLPWVIKISNDLVRLKTLVEQLKDSLDDNKTTVRDRLNAQGSKHRGLEKRVAALERGR